MERRDAGVGEFGFRSLFFYLMTEMDFLEGDTDFLYMNTL